jgi:hypothetical protein
MTFENCASSQLQTCMLSNISTFSLQTSTAVKIATAIGKTRRNAVVKIYEV